MFFFMSIAHLFSIFISLDDGIVTLYGLNMGRANQHKMNCNGQRERCPPPPLPFPGKKISFYFYSSFNILLIISFNIAYVSFPLLDSNHCPKSFESLVFCSVTRNIRSPQAAEQSSLLS